MSSRVGAPAVACQIWGAPTDTPLDGTKENQMVTRYTSAADTERDGTALRNLGHTHVTGGGGVRLHVVDTGGPGRAILFMHGFFSVVAHVAPTTVVGSDGRLSARRI
jgi:hypothetical protein